LVGAVLHSPLVAQVRDTSRAVRVEVPKREDSLLVRDSLLRRDSIRAANPPRDTIKAAFVQAEAPVLADPSGGYAWDRRTMFSTGALTVQDLLDRIPGLTSLRSGWISHPMSAAYLGDPGRVRVFFDGLELEELDPRLSTRIWDLTQIPLWALDDIRVERTASEIRIHMRSWRVDHTTPFTRTDIYTGDQGTNLYRGLFGRRYKHGEAIQFAGQQYGTNPGGLANGSDQLSMLVRTGVARPRWTADVVLLRGDRNRGMLRPSDAADTIPTTESTRTDAYARFGWGSTDRGFWAQALAHASKYTYGGESSTGTSTTTGGRDTTRYLSQYVAMTGYATGPWHVSFTQRALVGLQKRIVTPSFRGSYETPLLTLSAFAEGRIRDSTRRADVNAVIRPTSFVFLGASLAAERPELETRFVYDPADSANTAMTQRLGYAANFTRAEAGLRVRQLWLSGGIMRRDPVFLDAPTLYRKGTPVVADSSRQALFATIRGRVWKSLYADAQATQWNDTSGFYRPRYQTRSELYVSTSLPERFPSGNFHFLASVVHEYRSHMYWPDTTAAIRIPGYRTISTLLQVRILSAEVFWNYRNILGARYEQIPGYRAPRLSNLYGVRWEFWN